MSLSEHAEIFMNGCDFSNVFPGASPDDLKVATEIALEDLPDPYFVDTLEDILVHGKTPEALAEELNITTFVVKERITRQKERLTRNVKKILDS